MDFQRLPNASAMTSGAQLWVMPDLVRSSWTQIVDWYVNFQFSKTRQYQSPKLSPELQTLISDHKTGMYKISVSNKATTLVPTEKLLPAKQVALLCYDGDLAAWASKAEKVWTQLGHPAVRVFLPDDATSEEFLASWKTQNDTTKTFVAEN